jgi:hypothetical protein
VFWLADDGQTAYMTISNNDERQHEAPPGFELEEVIADDDDESETWVFVRSPGTDGGAAAGGAEWTVPEVPVA